MKNTINPMMISLDDVIHIINESRHQLNSAKEMGLVVSGESELLDRIEKRVRQLNTRRRLVVIDGGKK